MQFRRVMAAFLPAGAAAALAILPTGAFAGTGSVPHYAAGHVAKAVAGRVIPGTASPLAYRYEGKLNDNKRASGAVLDCQQPGSSPNCYTPQELAAAYDVPSRLTGAGKTIVIIDAFGDPTIAQDLAVEDTAFGLPTAKLNIIYPGGRPVFDPTNADESNWSAEIALDVESSHAIAPADTIDLVIAKSADQVGRAAGGGPAGDKRGRDQPHRVAAERRLRVRDRVERRVRREQRRLQHRLPAPGLPGGVCARIRRGVPDVEHLISALRVMR